MTNPDTQPAPFPELPAYKAQELAHIAWFTARALKAAQERQARRERDGVRQAMRDRQAGRDALRRAKGDLAATADDVPRPLDAQTFQKALGLAQRGPRWAEAVPLSGIGETGWAVVGEVSGVNIGYQFADQETALGVRDMIRYQPQFDPTVWQHTGKPLTSERWFNRYMRDSERTQLRSDYPAMVRGMRDVSDPVNRALAHNLLHSNPGTPLEAAIIQRFGEDIRNPPVENPTSSGTAQPVQDSGASTGASQQSGQPVAPPQEPQSTGQDARPAQTGTVQPSGQGDPQQPAGQGTAVAPAAAPSAGTSQGGPLVRETLPTAEGGTIELIDLAVAMREYPAVEPGKDGVGTAYRDSSGEPLTEDEFLGTDYAVETIAGMDSTNPAHRNLAMRWFGKGHPEVDSALEKRFRGLPEAIRERNRREAAKNAGRGTKATPAALAAARQRGEGQGGPQAGGAAQGTQRQTSRAAQKPAARRDAQHAQQ